MAVGTHVLLSVPNDRHLTDDEMHVGAYFDPGKLPEYGKEIRGRVSFAKVLPNFMTGVALNVSSW